MSTGSAHERSGSYFQLTDSEKDSSMQPEEPTAYDARVMAYASQMRENQTTTSVFENSASSSDSSGDAAPALRGPEGAPTLRRPPADYDDYFRYGRSGRQRGSSEGRSERAGCCCGRAVGNNVEFYRLSPRAKVFPRVCMWGPDWPCMFVTYALLIVPAIAFLVYVAPNLHAAVVALGVLICLFAVSVFTVTNAR